MTQKVPVWKAWGDKWWHLNTVWNKTGVRCLILTLVLEHTCLTIANSNQTLQSHTCLLRWQALQELFLYADLLKINFLVFTVFLMKEKEWSFDSGRFYILVSNTLKISSVV